MSAKVFVATGAVVTLLAGGWFGGRPLVDRRVEAALLVPGESSREPAVDFEIPASRFTIASGERRLQARLVRAPSNETSPTAVLIFHSNRTNIAQQLPLQLEFYKRGITSMVFDYSGFGSSTGTPSVARLRQDAVAAFAVFADSVDAGARKYVMGTSLGAAVLLDAIDEIQSGVDGVLIVGTFASARRLAVRERGLPERIAFILPNHYDNVGAAGRLRKPLLVLHSERDQRFPIADAEAIVAAAGGPAQLVRVSDGTHDDYLAHTAKWEPVVDFMKPSI